MSVYSFVEKYGGNLLINPSIIVNPTDTFCIDIETDEKDNFVGIAFTNDGINIGYNTSLTHTFSMVLKNWNLIGHNLKGDVKWLRQWGVNIKPEQLEYDTIVASYIKEPTRLRHGLKYLGKDILGIEWPSYEEMVGKGRSRHTLDTLPVEHVADYCGMDCLTTYRLYEWFRVHHTDNQKRIMKDIEMPLNRLLFQLEQRGVRLNLKRVKELDREFLNTIAILDVEINDLCKSIFYLLVSEKQIRKGWEKTASTKIKESGRINFSSWQQKKLVLHELGLNVETTDKKELIKYKDNPIVANMLQYSEYQKLHGFTQGFIESQKEGIIHTTFSQLTKNERGMTTGRISSRDINLMQIPIRTEAGNKLREVFVAREGMELICADYSQADLRVLAHYSQEPVFVEAFKQNKDIHQATADILGIERWKGKEINLAYANSVGAGKLSISLNIPFEDAKKVLEKFNNEMLTLSRWKEETLAKARDVQGIVTLHDWFVPIIGLDSTDWSTRGYAERQTISVLIQGGTAIIMKWAMLRLQEHAPEFSQLIQVHDEIVGEISKNNITLNTIKYIMEQVPFVELEIKIPFIVEIGCGKNWKEAKESSKVKT